MEIIEKLVRYLQYPFVSLEYPVFFCYDYTRSEISQRGMLPPGFFLLKAGGGVSSRLFLS